MGSAPYRISVEDGVMTMRWNPGGHPDLATVQAALLEILGHPDFRLGDPVIVVVPGTDFSPSREDLRRLAKMVASQRDMLGRTALVVEKLVHFGLGRMLQAYCEIEGLANFQVEQARAWARGEANPLQQSNGWALEV